MEIHSSPAPAGVKNICTVRTATSNPALPRPRGSTSSSHRSCFFCKASLGFRETQKMKKTFPADLYGNMFRKVCIIINSEHAIIEKKILSLHNEQVKALVHLCETCRSLMFHVYRVLEDSNTKLRSVIEEQVRLTKNILTFKILQSEKKVNLFPLPEGRTDPDNAHMYWETKLREMECVANLENEEIRQVLVNDAELLTPFRNGQPDLPKSLQQGYLTLNVLGYDYMEEEIAPSDDDEVQFIEEKSKSVEILGIDDETYAKLKAAATATTHCVPSSSVVLSSKIVPTVSAVVSPLPVKRLSQEFIQSGTSTTDKLVVEFPHAHVHKEPVTQPELPVSPSVTRNVESLINNVPTTVPVSPAKGITNESGSPPPKRQKLFPTTNDSVPYSIPIVTLDDLQASGEPVVGDEANSEVQNELAFQTGSEYEYIDAVEEHSEPVNFVERVNDTANDYGVASTDSPMEIDSNGSEVLNTDEEVGTYEVTPTDPPENFENAVVFEQSASYQFTCDVCSKAFPTRNGLNGHAWMHRRPYCALCRTFLLGMDEYRVHVDTHHDGSNPSNCFVCGKEFRNDYKLKIHLRSHKEGKTYSCSAEECKETFVTKVECIKHIKVCPFTPPLLRDIVPKRRAPRRNRVNGPLLPATTATEDNSPFSVAQSHQSESGSALALEIANQYTGFTLDEVEPEDEYLEDPSESEYYENHGFTMHAADEEVEEEYEAEYEYDEHFQEEEFEFEEPELIPVDPLQIFE